MTFLDSVIWNEMAEAGPLATEAAKVAFLLNREQISVMMDKWAEAEKQAGTSRGVITSLLTCLPLLAEREAVASYTANRSSLRNAIPEVFSTADAVSLMELEWRISPEEGKELVKALESPASLERWRNAALWAKENPRPMAKAPLEAQPGGNSPLDGSRARSCQTGNYHDDANCLPMGRLDIWRDLE